MEKFYNNINELINNEGIKITSLERKIGASQGVLSRAIRKNSTISIDWVIKILEKFPLYDANWLLTGKGNMLKEGADAPHLEPKNWIEDDLSRYEGSHDRAALERVGLNSCAWLSTNWRIISLSNKGVFPCLLLFAIH